MKTPEQKAAVEQIIESIAKAREEAHQYTLVAPHMSCFVVCFKPDLAPFRTNGREIRMFGGEIWANRRHDVAITVASQLNDKSKKTSRPDDIIAMNACDWGRAREAKLDEMLATLRASLVQA